MMKLEKEEKSQEKVAAAGRWTGEGKLSLDRQMLTDWLRWAWQGLTSAVSTFWLERSRLVELMVLMLGLVIGVSLIVRLLLLAPQLPEEMAIGRERRLVTPIIDKLEVWIEERSTQYEQAPDVPTAIFP